MSKTYDDLVDEITSGDGDLGAYYSIEQVGKCAWDCQQRKLDHANLLLKKAEYVARPFMSKENMNSFGLKIVMDEILKHLEDI